VALRELCLRRWPNRVVDARTVILAATLLCYNERVLWDCLYDLTGPPQGVAQMVDSPHRLVLSVGSREKPVVWGADGAFITGTEVDGALYQHGLRWLRRRGADPETCGAGLREWFVREPLDDDRLMAAAAEERLHPEIRSALAAVQAIYARAALEADELCRPERATLSFGNHAFITDAQAERWRAVEGQARRRLVTLMGNPRLVGM
jgi:hypothetical protein